MTVLAVGAVAPAAMTYARLARLVETETPMLLRDPVCFVGPLPPGYTLEAELAALEAASRGPVNLVGYSVGGSVALAFASRHPERVRTLTLIEPAWIGPPWSDDEAAFSAGLDAVMRLPAAERGPALLRAVDPYVAPEPPAWLGDRPSRFSALWQALREAAPGPDYEGRLYLPVAGRSHPRFLAAARRLAGRNPCAKLELYSDCSHLDPPQTRAPEQLAQALREFWRR